MRRGTTNADIFAPMEDQLNGEEQLTAQPRLHHSSSPCKPRQVPGRLEKPPTSPGEWQGATHCGRTEPDVPGISPDLR